VVGDGVRAKAYPTLNATTVSSGLRLAATAVWSHPRKPLTCGVVEPSKCQRTCVAVDMASPQRSSQATVLATRSLHPGEVILVCGDEEVGQHPRYNVDLLIAWGMLKQLQQQRAM